MNEEQYVIENREMDFVDFLKSMVEEWRGWLTCGLLFGLLFMFFMSYKQFKSIEPAEPTTFHYYAGTSDLNGTDVALAVSYFYLWKQWADYENESPIMKMDGENVRKLTVCYCIYGDEGGSTSFKDYYLAQLSGETFLEMLSEVIGFEGDYRYLSDLVSLPGDISYSLNNNTTQIDFQPTSSSSNIICFNVYLPGECDDSKVEKAISEFLNQQNTELSELFGNHSIKLMSSDFSVSYDQAIIGLQSVALNNYYQYRNSFNAAYNALDASSRLDADRIIDQLMDGTVCYTDLKEEYPLMIVESGTTSYETLDSSNIIMERKLSFNPLFALVGFFAGLFVYVGIALFYIVIVNRFRNGKEASTSLGIRSYGDIYEYPYRGIKAFLHDRRVYKWRHKYSAKVEDVAEGIAAKSKYGSVEKLTCIVVGDSGEHANSIIDSIRDLTMKSGVGFDVKKSVNGIISLQEDEIPNYGPVLLTIISGQTRPIHVAEIITRLEEYKIPVFGMSFIECP